MLMVLNWFLSKITVLITATSKILFAILFTWTRLWGYNNKLRSKQGQEEELLPEMSDVTTSNLSGLRTNDSENTGLCIPSGWGAIRESVSCLRMWTEGGGDRTLWSLHNTLSLLRNISHLQGCSVISHTESFQVVVCDRLPYVLTVPKAMFWPPSILSIMSVVRAARSLIMKEHQLPAS